MPNWVENHLTITGPQASLDRLRTLVGKSYKSYHQDFITNKVEEVTVVGAFLLWNIDRPTDLASYYNFTSDEKFLERQARTREAETSNPSTPEALLEKLQGALTEIPITEDLLSQFTQEIQEGQDWYNWNVREWGTKWEIRDAQVSIKPGKLLYSYQTAWSPPLTALNKLATTFPDLTFHTRFLDEMDCFAGETGWSNGEITLDGELRIDHALKVEMDGFCWACQTEQTANNPEYEELRREYRCGEYNNLKVPDTLEGIS